MKFLPVFMLCLLLGTAYAAPGDAGSDSNLQGLQRAISEAQADLNAKQNAKQQAQSTLDKAQSALKQAQNELATLSRRQQDSWQKLQALQNDLERLKGEIGNAKAQIARLLNAHYRNRQNNAVMLFLKNAETGRKARYLAYARYISEANGQVVAKLAQQQQELKQREAAVDQELAELKRLQGQKQGVVGKLGKAAAAAQQETARLDDQIDQQSQKLAQLRADEVRLTRLVADIARRNAEKRRQEAAARTAAARQKQAAERAKAQQAAEQAKADADKVQTASAGQTAPPAAKGKEPVLYSTLTVEDMNLQAPYEEESNSFSRLQGRLPRPSGGSLSGRFGQPRPGGGTWRGVFYATPPGAVRSVAEGTVAYVGSVGGFGNTVIIDHGNGYTTIYTGLSGISTGSGRKVAAGSTIGTSGSLPGGEQGLYFEIRYKQTAMNPLAWLRG